MKTELYVLYNNCYNETRFILKPWHLFLWTIYKTNLQNGHRLIEIFDYVYKWHYPESE